MKQEICAPAEPDRLEIGIICRTRSQVTRREDAARRLAHNRHKTLQVTLYIDDMICIMQPACGLCEMVAAATAAVCFASLFA